MPKYSFSRGTALSSAAGASPPAEGGGGGRGRSAAGRAGAAGPAVLSLTSCLYIEVDNFAEALERIRGTEVLVPQRDTFYGMREIYVREPEGQMVGFATRTPQTAKG